MRRPALALAAVLLLAAAPAAANCFEFGGFAIFQCGDLAFFTPPPDWDPNAYPIDPNGHVPSISAVFWQIGFGNQRINNGSGPSGTGNFGASTFNGNDSGLWEVDLMDARTATQFNSIPEGATCLSSNNWANYGVDGCCDNDRTTSPLVNNDDILNPFYDVYDARGGSPGYYSLDWQQDYPMGLLLKSRLANYFAFAAVSTMTRFNQGGNGVCANAPGTNPAACDFRPGFYSFQDVTNGLPNTVRAGARNNIVPWQATPSPIVTSDVAVDPNNPASDHILEIHWPAVTIYSDQSVRPTTHPAMGGGGCTSLACGSQGTRDLTRAPGVGVADIAGKFGLVHFILEVTAPNDPNFASPLA